MIGRYAVLSQRLRQELATLQPVVERVARATRAWQRGTPDSDLFLDAAALNLHDVYAGLERIFRRVATDIDGSIPAGADWHRELLQQMTVEIPGLRPRVLSPELAQAMDELLRFRHVVRHVYASDLDPERMHPLAERLPLLFAQIQAELLSFADALDDLSRSA